jgi:thiol:disulfide interchange protein DsbA
MIKNLPLVLLFTAMLSACGQSDNTETSTVTAQSTEISIPDKVTHQPQVVLAPYQQDVHYRVVSGIDVSDFDTTKPYIMEYFWLGCPHCQDMEPKLHEFAKDQGLSIFKKHAALNPRWGQDARIFYALEEMGRLDLLNEMFTLYAASAKEKRQPSRDEIAALVEAAGEQSVLFFDKAGSPAVLDKIQTGLNEMIKNKITGVPALVVNGKYIIKGHPAIKTEADYFNLLAYLLTLDK